MQCNCTSYVRAFPFVSRWQLMIFSVTVASPAKTGSFTSGETLIKKPHTQFTCVKCCLSVKPGKLACIYASSLSRRIHATACNKAGKMKVTSAAGCSLTYLRLRVFCQQIVCILLAIVGIFCLRLRVHLAVKAGNLAW